MAQLLVVSPAADRPPAIPVLELLHHTLRELPPDGQVVQETARADAVVVDGRTDLQTARALCRLLAAANAGPVLLVLGEGGFAAVNAEWAVADIVHESAGPGEYEARLRLLLAATASDQVLSAGPLTIDETAYHAALDGRPLDLTYTEFELLKYLVQHPGRVCGREQLLSDVWGYDYYGGTRTVDVHIRRLRAKLGAEHEALISTVRNVGYRFSPDAPRAAAGEGRALP